MSNKANLLQFSDEYNFFYATVGTFTGFSKVDRTSFQRVLDETVGRLGMFVVGASGILRGTLMTATNVFDCVISGIISFDKKEFQKAKNHLYQGILKVAFFVAIATAGVLFTKITLELLFKLDRRSSRLSKLLATSDLDPKTKYNCVNARVMLVSRFITNIFINTVIATCNLAEYPFKRELFWKNILFSVAYPVIGVIALVWGCVNNKKIKDFFDLIPANALLDPA